MPDPTPRPPLFTRIFPLLILAAVVALFFAPALFLGKVYFLRDLSMEIVPKRQFWADHHGFVLWNPFVFAGEPYAANPQSSAFYPLSLLWLLGPAEVMLGPYLAAHFLVAGLFAYFLFLELGLKRTSALAGALALILGGGFASLQLQVVNLNSAVWIPGIFWMAIRMGKANSLRPSVLLGVFIALQILGGEPEICYLTLLALFAYLLFTAKSGGWKIWPRLILALGLALGLSAVQWVLTLEMTGLSNRAAGFSLAEASAYSLEARDLISLLVPHAFLDPRSQEWGFGFWSQRLPFFLSIYPGVIVLLLLPAAFRSGRRREALFWTGLAVISLWLALGPEGHLYTFAHRLLPGFDRFRFPERALILFGLALAWLAALGVEAIPEKIRLVDIKFSQQSLFIIMALVALPFLIWQWSHRPESLNPGDELFFSYQQRSIWFAMLWVFLFIETWITPPRQSYFRLLPALMTALFFFDLYLAHRHLNPLVDRAFYSRIPAWAQDLKSSNGPLPDRVYITPPAKLQDQYLRRDQAPLDFYRLQREGLQPFFALAYSIPDLGAYSSFRLALFDEMHSLLAQADPGRRDRLLALSGVSRLAIPGQGIRAALNPLPHAYLAFAERRVENHAQALEFLLDWEFDPEKEVILEDETGSPRLSDEKPIQAVTVKRYENEQVEIATEADHSGWLVLLDTFYPGWQAWVDGKPAPVRRANGFFRAVYVPAGQHQVKFEYRPSHWRLAQGLTVGAALLAGLLVFIPRRRRQEDAR